MCKCSIRAKLLWRNSTANMQTLNWNLFLLTGVVQRQVPAHPVLERCHQHRQLRREASTL
eukprot:12902901-Prorocentrum_lima.AAC.1